MSSTAYRLLFVSFAATLSLTLAAQQPAGTVTTNPTSQSADYTPDTTPPHGTYPQIVRLSLVEGDVRIARGKQDAKLTGNTWEQAAAGIPLESGFNLATGANGRAEIEFEDASTIYLAPNSALSLPNLSTTDGVPHTSLALLSGSVTLNLKPNIPGDDYRLETPTHAIDVAYGDNNFSRITSYLDGLQVTAMENTHIGLNHVSRAAPAGSTYELSGASVRRTNAKPPPDLAAFDAWVKQRVIARDAAMKLVMQQSGLKTPLPGLADLAGKGTFVPCAPYGTCWQPNDGWVKQQSTSNPAPVANSDTASAAPADQAQSTPIHPLPESNGAPAQNGANVINVSTTAPRSQVAPVASYAIYDLDDAFPCSPWQYWYRRSLLLYPDDFNYPYDWTVCHAGYWINRNNHYLWVVGTHKHHRCPVHWVKYQGKLGYVPDHPRDRHGAVPVNIRHGIYSLTDKPNHPVQRVAFEGKAPPKVFDQTPKDFRTPAPPLLARADSPELGVRFMHEAPLANMTGSRAASSLTFDPNHQRFMLTSRVTEGGRTHTFTAPMSSHGGHIASASAGGYRAGPSGSAPSHGGYSGGSSAARSGGGSSGGGSRGGGGGGFSGGGGHSGGGSSASSASSASSGGGHH